MTNMYSITPTEIAIWRDTHYRRLPDMAVHTEDSAARFIDDIGFCVLFPVAGMELPSLWEAINGQRRALPRHHFDYALSLTWEFKDSLPSKKRLYYGKLLRQKPTLVSLPLLPYFYALSNNYGDLDDYLEAYADGRLSEPAKRVCDVLLEHGPSPTSTLRWQAGLGGKENAARFDRAISELQAGLHIVKSGISDSNRWKYCYVYDLLPRWLPEVVQKATEIKSRHARQVLITKYLEMTLVATVPHIISAFGWEPSSVKSTVDRLIAEGLVDNVGVDGSAVPHIALSSIAGRALPCPSE